MTMKPTYIETIPHSSQRYETVGDYYDRGGITYIEVSHMGNKNYEFLVALHELIESFLCGERGISEASITQFDMQFEKDREEGLHGPEEEPGDAPDSPYKREHFFATSIERLMAADLGVDWVKYDMTVRSLTGKITSRGELTCR